MCWCDSFHMLSYWKSNEAHQHSKPQSMTDNKRAFALAKKRQESGLPLNARMRKALANEKKNRFSSEAYTYYPHWGLTPEEDRNNNHLDKMEERRLDLESMACYDI